MSGAADEREGSWAPPQPVRESVLGAAPGETVVDYDNFDVSSQQHDQTGARGVSKDDTAAAIAAAAAAGGALAEQQRHAKSTEALPVSQKQVR